MENFNILQAILSILSGLVVIIPLIIQLVRYIKSAIKEKNWSNLIKIVIELMEQAEINFKTGAERKEWVMSEVQRLGPTINYNIDMEVISNMIDSLCAMSKIINVRG